MAQDDRQAQQDSLLVAESKSKTARPPFYKVILFNDDYTPMDFVVEILLHVFHKETTEAFHLMMNVHQQGSAVCGVYTREVAETKTAQVLSLARENEHPLQCVMEKE
jgi:ATP-dependent Clp protease adaptor protein ClpS